MTTTRKDVLNLTELIHADLKQLGYTPKHSPTAYARELVMTGVSLYTVTSDHGLYRTTIEIRWCGYGDPKDTRVYLSYGGGDDYNPTAAVETAATLARVAAIALRIEQWLTGREEDRTPLAREMAEED